MQQLMLVLCSAPLPLAAPTQPVATDSYTAGVDCQVAQTELVLSVDGDATAPARAPARRPGSVRVRGRPMSAPARRAPESGAAHVVAALGGTFVSTPGRGGLGRAASAGRKSYEERCTMFSFAQSSPPSYLLWREHGSHPHSTHSQGLRPLSTNPEGKLPTIYVNFNRKM